MEVALVHEAITLNEDCIDVDEAPKELAAALSGTKSIFKSQTFSNDHIFWITSKVFGDQQIIYSVT